MIDGTGTIGESEASDMAAIPLTLRDEDRMSTSDADELMTSAEVMAYMGWSRMTLERRMKSGALQAVNRSPTHYRPKVLLFRRADVERLARGEMPPAEG